LDCFINQFVILFSSYSFLSNANIERIIKQFLQHKKTVNLIPISFHVLEDMLDT
jgi:hypothetical protein